MVDKLVVLWIWSTWIRSYDTMEKQEKKVLTFIKVQWFLPSYRVLLNKSLRQVRIMQNVTLSVF